MSDAKDQSRLCTQVDEAMADILEGTASDELYDHLADCDRCRDARHDAERATEVVAESSADYVHPPGFEARVEAALDGVSETAQESDDDPEPITKASLEAPPAPSETKDEPAEPTEEKAEDEAPQTLPIPEGGAPEAAEADEKATGRAKPSPTQPMDGPPPMAEPAKAEELETAASEPPEDAIADKFAEEAGAEAEEEKAKVTSLMGRLRRPRNGIIAGLVGAALAAASVSFWMSPTGTETEEEVAEANAPWKGRVVKVSRAAGGEGGLELCDSGGSDCKSASSGATIEAGTLLRTDDRTRAYVELNDGTRLALDRSTELGLDKNKDRHGKLAKGAIVAEVEKVTDSKVRVDLPRGHIQVLGTKFALRANGDTAAVDVSRGTVLLVDEQDRSVKVRSGEEGRSFPGAAPYASSAASLSEALSWSETAEEEKIAVRGLGELKAKKPGSKDEKQGAVKLTSHSVKVRVVDGFARTEVEEVFTNTTGEVLEGIYRFPMPPDAQIERLALEVDGKMEEGAFVDRDKAAAIWRGAIVNAAPKQPRPREEIIWVPGPWKDPALLEWQRGGRFELRIFPIPANGARKVVLTYTQVIQPVGGVRRYVYPLAHDPSGALRVDRFDVDVQVRGHDRGFGIATQGYGMNRGGSGEADSLTLSEQSFVPSGDLVVEYATADRDTELSAWAYQPTGEIAADDADKDGKSKAAGQNPTADRVPRIDQGAAATVVSTSDGSAPYVAMAVRPRLPRRSDDAQRAYVFVVDSSRSMFGERYKRAAALTARTIKELDRLDRFTVLACDTTCRSLPGGMRVPSHEASREVKQFLDGITPEGGSDPAASMRDASSTASHAEGRQLRVVYIGDGTPTVGPIRPGDLTKAAQAAMPSGRGTLTAVAIGADADLDALAALARGGSGTVLPYVPGQRTNEAAYAILGASYGMGLSDVKLELPEGLVEVAPKAIDTIARGGETIVVARMTRPQVNGTVVLRGKVGDDAFEQTYRLDVTAVAGQSNAFVPRLYASKRIADLERAGTASARDQAVALSSRFNVASRHTSLLVLESPAMFRAFGLDNTRRAPEWTGEMGVMASKAKGDRKLAEDEEAFGPGGTGGPMDSYDDDAMGFSGPPAKKARMAKPMATATGGWAEPPQPAPPPASRPRPDSVASEKADRMDWERPQRRRGMIAMRKIWERHATIHTGRLTPLAASFDKIAEAETKLNQNENSRDAVKNLYKLLALSGQLDRATTVAERWSEKEALDPEALTARADLVARKGNRSEAIRILGSVVDVRPGDVPAQKRLARLHRWAGRAVLGCRHSIAVAQIHQKDAKLLSEAVFCGRKTGESLLVQDMLSGADDKTRKAAEAALTKMKDETGLRGELRLEAKWDGGSHDLDISLIHPDGHRVSWLGAPTRAIISAEDVHSTSREALALLGSKAGEYVIEITRASGQGTVRGTLTVRVAGATRSIPFVLDGDRLTLGTVRVFWKSRLVRANRW